MDGTLSVTHRRHLSAAVLAAALVLAFGACGATKHPATSPTTLAAVPQQAGPTIPAAKFCSHISTLDDATSAVGVDTSLPAVRRDLAKAVTTAESTRSGGTPPDSGMYAILAALTRDLQTVNSWVQTEATQRDLDTDNQPASVKSSFDDLGPRFRSIQAWSARYCQSSDSDDS